MPAPTTSPERSRASVTTLIDPCTGRPRGEQPRARGAEVARVVGEARRAARPWARLCPRERAARLLELAGLIEGDAERYAGDERAGTGKPAAHAREEVLAAADLARFYAGALRAELAPAAGERLPGHESWVRWEPMGVVGAIVPWNYPLLMALWRVAPALAAGNAVVLKPAESTPDSALRLAAHAAQALGPGVLATLTGDRATGRLLAGSEVDALAFTGSPAGGEDVARRAGIRPVSLELGGNCAAVVLPDAPDGACEALVRASCHNAGQSCAAPARVIALRECYGDVVEGLARAVASTAAGRDFGPLNNPDQLARYDRLVGPAAAGRRTRGACSPGAERRDGYWRPACVLADLPGDDPAVVEEVFGPVLTVQAADTVAHALALANGVPQALAASVWSRGLEGALALGRALDAGEVWINCHLVQTAELPHGGRRGSGSGTDMSVLALDEYRRPKTITACLEPGGRGPAGTPPDARP